MLCCTCCGKSGSGETLVVAQSEQVLHEDDDLIAEDDGEAMWCDIRLDRADLAQDWGLKYEVWPNCIQVLSSARGLEPDDVIIEINKVADVKVMQKMLQDVRTSSLQLRVCRPQKLVIDLPRMDEREPWGIRVEFKRRFKGLVVTEISQGKLTARHNALSAPRTPKLGVGDLIVSINGVVGLPQHMAKVMQDAKINQLELVILRLPLFPPISFGR